MMSENAWGADWLLDQDVPVCSEEVPGHVVAAGVPADRDHHVREVLSLHHHIGEAVLHHPEEKQIRVRRNLMLAVWCLYIMYPPLELLLQRTGGHCRFHAALYRHLQGTAVLLQQEVPPLWCSSSNQKHRHGDVDREAKNRQGSITIIWQTLNGKYLILKPQLWQHFLRRILNKYLTSWCRQTPSTW